MSAENTSESLSLQAFLALPRTSATCRVHTMTEKSKPRPYAAQGDKLKNARDRRPMSAIQKAVGANNVQTIQNWEAGYNRPDPKYWGALSAALNIDVAALYAGVPGGTEKLMLDPEAVRPMIEKLRDHLDSATATLHALEVMVRPAVPNKRLHENGYTPVKTK